MKSCSVISVLATIMSLMTPLARRRYCSARPKASLSLSVWDRLSASPIEKPSLIERRYATVLPRTSANEKTSATRLTCERASASLTPKLSPCGLVMALAGFSAKLKLSDTRRM